MSSQTYVTLPGQSRREEWLRRSAWLPSLAQAVAALRLAPDDALDPAERGAVTVTMRQGLGLVVVLGLLAGVIPFIANLWLAIPHGRLGAVGAGGARGGGIDRRLSRIPAAGHRRPHRAEPGRDRTHHAGRPGRHPLGAGPVAQLALDWLGNWIVYGAAVFVVAHILGSRTMLPSLYAATSFAAVPLVLTGLQPIPFLGPLAAIAGVIWAAIVYFRFLRYASGLATARTLIAMLLPVAALLFLPLLALGALGTLLHCSNTRLQTPFSNLRAVSLVFLCASASLRVDSRSLAVSFRSLRGASLRTTACILPHELPRQMPNLRQDQLLHGAAARHWANPAC